MQRLLLIPLISTCLAASAAAEPGTDAWPQWGGGPARDFTAQAAELATAWPDDGPELLWQRELGDDGYPGLGAAGGRL